jgi:PAS domain S-box-containing protein
MPDDGRSLDELLEEHSRLQRQLDELNVELARHTEPPGGSEEFRAVVESIADGVMVADAQRIVRYANPSLLGLLGKTAGELVGLPFPHPLVPGKRLEISSTRGAGRTETLEMRVGRARWRGRPAYAATFRPITQRKKLEGYLREKEQQYDALFNNPLVLVYVHDFGGRFVDANPAALKLFGYSSAELGGIRFGDLLAPEDVARAKKAMQYILEHGRDSGVHEYEVRAKDGRRMRVAVTGARIDRGGAPYGVLGVGHVISADESKATG